MASPITTGLFPKMLWPGARSWFGLKYEEAPMVCDMIFDQMTSTKAKEEDVAAVGMGLAATKPEGDGISYDSMNQEGTATYTHVVYGLGFVITREAIEDNQYEMLGKKFSGALARSMRHTREIIHANILNRAFSSSYTGYDGKELCATDHSTSYGDQSNELATAADLSEAALEDMVILSQTMRDSRGLRINVDTKRLIIPVQLTFEAQRILKSSLQSGTGNNDVNALRSMGSIPEITPWRFLTDEDAFFLQTDVSDGLKTFNRRKTELSKDNEFDTENAKHKATMRFSTGWSDWHCIIGSEGA